jgi:hypothetical protein
MGAWAADPLIPEYAGLFPLPGIFGFNESAGRVVPYKDTTKVSWDAQYEVRAHTQSPFAHPRDLVIHYIQSSHRYILIHTTIMHSYKW